MTHRPNRTILSATLAVSLAFFSVFGLDAAEPTPEKSNLEVAIAAWGPLYLPLLVAHESGYFSKRGVNLNISQLSATASAQALISGQIDLPGRRLDHPRQRRRHGSDLYRRLGGPQHLDIVWPEGAGQLRSAQR
jgi:hypothetical protein